MRNDYGDHVSGQDDDVCTNIRVFGSFEVRYFGHIDRVCVEVRGKQGWARMSMQLTLEQAQLLRDLVDAGIADAVAAKAVPVQPEPVRIDPGLALLNEVVTPKVAPLPGHVGTFKSTSSKGATDA